VRCRSIRRYAARFCAGHRLNQSRQCRATLEQRAAAAAGPATGAGGGAGRTDESRQWRAIRGPKRRARTYSRSCSGTC
jgi:hypothetical protein